MIKKILLVLLAIIVLIVIGFVIFVNTSYNKNFNEEYPVTELNVIPDSAMLAHGEYLVNGPAHCAHCHVPADQLAKVENGEQISMSGGFGLDIPPGTFHAPNITSDNTTGIGNLSDGELYRMMRYNINHKGEPCFDFMPFINMTDDDIYSIIAYLRTLEPRTKESRTKELSFLGKMIYAVGGVNPGVPDEPIMKSIKKEVSIAYGEYLAYAVANCRGCHTSRDMKTGAYLGENYVGGLVFGPDNLTNGWIYTTPNLTPDLETGIMAKWTEADFVKRMREGRTLDYSPMPWGAFKNMDDDDLKALFLFFKSLDPVVNSIEETAVLPEES